MSISQIRSLIQDQPLYNMEDIVCDNETTFFQLTRFPVVRSSLIINSAVPTYTVDWVAGTVNFVSPPAPGEYTVNFELEAGGSITESITADGVSLVWDLSYTNLNVDTLEILNSPIFSVDENSGMVIFSTPPSAYIRKAIYRYVLLSDSTIQDFIDIETEAGNEDVRLAAASAIDAIASSQALIQKRIKMLDLETDGPSLAKALREHSKSLRELVYSTDFQSPDFEVIEMVNDAPGWLEKTLKDWEREG